MIDVAIVGAGPVGTIAANLCGVFGLSAAVFDRTPGVYPLPRAAALHDDAQRILHNAGVLDAILPATCEMLGAEFLDASGARLTGIDVPAGFRTPNGYPVLLNIDQPGIERAIRSCLGRYDDVELSVSHEVLGFEQDADGVRLDVCDLARDRTRRVQARWLIGADGASSFVRKSCGIGWHSLGYDCEWLVIDLELRRAVDLPPLCQQLCDPERPTTIIPMPGKLRRWEFQLKAGETREQMEDPARVWALLRPWLSRDDGEIVRSVVYRFHATVADTFREGRVFLAGDAAHQMPPFMGQGLCTGIRDVENLIWKLAMVGRGQADSALLDTYTAERRPLAVAMVEHSTNTGKLIDAYAEMARGGPEPDAELRQYAYGGGRMLPDLNAGLLAPDSSAWAGQLVPHAMAEGSDGPRTLDDVVGPRWSILARSDVRPHITEATRRFWDDLGTAFLTIAEPTDALRALLSTHEVVVVRPDRIIYAAGLASSLDDVTRRLRARFTSQRTT